VITPTQTIKNQVLYMGGTNNYAVDDINFVNPPPNTDPNTILGRVTAASPSNSIQVFPIPSVFADGTPASSVSAQFVDWLLNGLGVQYEIALSTCPGDFQYYKTQTATDVSGSQPCGIIMGSVGSLNWSAEGTFLACKTNVAPSKTWYLNWRLVPGSGGNCVNNQFGHTCGQAFYTSHF
jgi:hypothetical protein